MKKIGITTILFAGLATSGSAAIISVVETGLDGDAPAIIESANFGEDALTFSDREHQHNGAAFDAGGILSTSGTNIVGLPSYLLGNDYVRFANDARDQAGYSAVVTADINTRWYLLLDNRVGDADGSTDPVLGGATQWVIDGGWERVNTGISPNGQADYTGVDEGGEGTGAGVSLNQFYSVYTLDGTAVTVSNIQEGRNMISVVAGQVPEPSTGLLGLLGGLAFLFRRRR